IPCMVRGDSGNPERGYKDADHMNVVVILPTPSSGPDAVRSWEQQLTPNDRVHILTIAGSSGNFHPLEIDAEKGRRWPSRWIRAMGWRLVTRGSRIWGPYLSDIWPELLWNIQSFDPDVIDLRWLHGSGELECRLREKPWCIIASEKNLPGQLKLNKAWRSYD